MIGVSLMAGGCCDVVAVVLGGDRVCGECGGVL